MSDSTSAMYDSLAGHYRSYSDKRSQYIEAVDAFILRSVASARSVESLEPKRLLDVGAGDGVRGMRLAGQLGVSDVVLFDSSPEMIQRCRSFADAEVIIGDAQNLPNFERSFDIVCLLWNVLGHIDSREKRIQTLKGIARAMHRDSVLFMDVNNRHNGGSYGKWRVFYRVIIDAMFPNESRGDVSYHWQVEGRSIPGRGHVFTYREVESLLAAAGLKILDRVFIDYANGETSMSRFLGQIVLKVGLAG